LAAKEFERKESELADKHDALKRQEELARRDRSDAVDLCEKLREDLAKQRRIVDEKEEVRVFISYYSILVWAIQLTEMCFVYLFTGGDETLGSGASTAGRGVDATFRGLDPDTAGLVISSSRTGDMHGEGRDGG
jgi:hypothetical protein